MNEQEFEIGGIAHLSAAELAQSAYRERARRMIAEMFKPDRGGFIEYDFREIGKPLREFHQCDLWIQEMLRIDKKYPIVLEPIQDLPFFFDSRGVRKVRAEFPTQDIFVCRRLQFQLRQVF